MQAVRTSRRDVIRAGSLAAAWAALSACSPSPMFAQRIPGDIPSAEIAPQPAASPTTAIPASVPTATTPSPTQPLSEEALLLHTLRRMSFGVTRAMLEPARPIGLDAYVEKQLNPEQLDNRAVEERVYSLDTMNRTLKELLEEQQRGRFVEEFLLATLMRQSWSPRQVYEMMIDFWTNHFNVYIGKNIVWVLRIFDDHDAIRPNALATFPQLLHASAHSPTMLVYLDQAYSSKDAPNENYAR